MWSIPRISAALRSSTTAFASTPSALVTGGMVLRVCFHMKTAGLNEDGLAGAGMLVEWRQEIDHRSDIDLPRRRAGEHANGLHAHEQFGAKLVGCFHVECGAVRLADAHELDCVRAVAPAD